MSSLQLEDLEVDKGRFLVPATWSLSPPSCCRCRACRCVSSLLVWWSAAEGKFRLVAAGSEDEEDCNDDIVVVCRSIRQKKFGVPRGIFFILVVGRSIWSRDGGCSVSSVGKGWIFDLSKR